MRVARSNRVSLKLKFVRDDELFCFNDVYIRFHITIRNGVSGSQKAEQWRRLFEKAEPGG